MRLGDRVLPELVEYAGERDVRLIIENCVMEGWHPDGYPGNLAYSPELWHWVTGLGFGAELGPSHLTWIGIDPVETILPFAEHIVHAQAKDLELFPGKRNEYGFFGKVDKQGDPWDMGWWRFRVPGRGVVDWPHVVDRLYEAGFTGTLSVEHEDRCGAARTRRSSRDSGSPTGPPPAHRRGSLSTYRIDRARWSHEHDREGELVIDRIKAWGVSRVFGYPGDGIGAFDGALGKADGSERALEYVRPTHEEIAALMATAHAKFTGEVGVCVATSSPGAFHLLNGLYDAQMDNQPVVAIVGQQGLASIGSFTQQESNLERVFADVACYVETVATPDAVGVVVDTAFRTAMLRKQPAVVVLPHDVQAMAYEAPAAEHWVSRSSDVAPSTRIAPPADEIARFAEILNAGEKITLLVGAGARGATDQVLAVAEKTGAGIITALRGKDVVPSDVPYHTQQVGLLGQPPEPDADQGVRHHRAPRHELPLRRVTCRRAARPAACRSTSSPSRWACGTRPS